MESNARIRLVAVCCLMLILSAGCAALSPLTAKRETLEERVKNYMQAQVDGKWDIAYSFLDASSRERIARDNYLNRTKKLSYKGFSIENIAELPSGDEATVKVRIEISFMGYNFKGALQTQNWVKENGEWFVKSESGQQTNPFSRKKN